MTDKEIIQALECCGKNHITGSTDACEHCFLQNSAMCVTELIYKALDLINRIKGDVIHYRRKAQNQKQELSRLNAEIEKLTINMNAFGLGMKREKERADQIKAEVIKEFAEILKEFMHTKFKYLDAYEFEYVTENDIYNLVQEMVGEGK